MQLSIIIINFNTFQLTVDCIQSVIKYTAGLEYEIILVDTYPETDYKDRFLRLFPQVKYILCRENVGFGRANNLGMEVATGKYFLLLNSDTLVLDNSIGACFRYMEADTKEETGLLGCKLLYEDRSYQPSFYPYRKGLSVWNYMITNNPVLYKVFGAGKKYAEKKHTEEVGDVSGAYMFLRRKVYDELKGFDPDFFLYCEETEWCRNRIGRHYNIIYYPEAAIIHYGGKSAPREDLQVQGTVSLGLFWYKTGWMRYILFILFCYFNALYYLLTYPFSGADGKKTARNYMHNLMAAGRYWFRDIPLYRRGFGMRKDALIYEGAKKIFFRSK